MKLIVTLYLSLIITTINGLIPLNVSELIAMGVFVVSSGIFNALLRTYITYTLTNFDSGQTYIGRASGFGDPYKILHKRFSSHKYRKSGFDNPQLDKAIQGKMAYQAIRGREQILIEYYGGISSPLVANKVNGISKYNIFRSNFLEVAHKYFDKI